MTASSERRRLQYPIELPHWKGLRFIDDKTVRKIDSWGDQVRVHQTIELLTYLKNNPHPTIVPILDCRKISSTEYSYDMPLMAMLSESESELVSLYSDGPAARHNEHKKLLCLKNKHPKLFQVVKKLDSWETYVDLHEGNVMRDRYGNYRLIDIEGFGLFQFTAHDIINDITKRR